MESTLVRATATAELTASGRLRLLPGELELRYATDVCLRRLESREASRSTEKREVCRTAAPTQRVAGGGTLSRRDPEDDSPSLLSSRDSCNGLDHRARGCGVRE